MTALISFTCVTEHAVQRLCAPSFAQARPWCTEDTCMGVVLISTIDKVVPLENQVCNENGATRHLSYDKQSVPAAQDEDRPGCC